jgi:hypothetical protein
MLASLSLCMADDQWTLREDYAPSDLTRRGTEVGWRAARETLEQGRDAWRDAPLAALARRSTCCAQMITALSVLHDELALRVPLIDVWDRIAALRVDLTRTSLAPRR